MHSVIANELWPESSDWPADFVRHWLHEQHIRGIWFNIVRQSSLRNESDLLADMGNYGSRALRIQELDDKCRTVRFVLTFVYTKLVEAEARWTRLGVFAESYCEHLDRYQMPIYCRLEPELLPLDSSLRDTDLPPLTYHVTA